MLVDASSSTPCEPSSDERPFDLQPAELAKALPTVASPRPQHHCPASIPSFWEPLRQGEPGVAELLAVNGNSYRKKSTHLGFQFFLNANLKFKTNLPVLCDLRRQQLHLLPLHLTNVTFRSLCFGQTLILFPSMSVIFPRRCYSPSKTLTATLRFAKNIRNRKTTGISLR